MKTSTESTKVMESTALVTLDPVQYVAETFAPFQARLELAINENTDVIYDVATTEGLAKAKELRALYKAIRIDAERMRKERKDPILKIGKLLDSHYEQIEVAVKAHEEVHDKAVKAQEAIAEAAKAERIRLEEERKSQINAAILVLTDAPAKAIPLKANQVAELLETVKGTAITKEVFGERDVEAENAKYKAIEALNTLHQSKVTQEAAEAQQALQAQAQQAQAIEQQRVDSIKAKITALESNISKAAMLESSAEVETIIMQVEKTTIDDTYAEFKAHAEATKANVLKALGRTLNMVKSEEAAAAQAAPVETEPAPVEAPAAGITLPGNLEEQFQEHVAQPLRSVPTRTPPTANQIVEVIANHYAVDKATAHKWLSDTDFDELLMAA
jgi:hypothetical protein